VPVHGRSDYWLTKARSRFLAAGFELVGGGADQAGSIVVSDAIRLTRIIRKRKTTTEQNCAAAVKMRVDNRGTAEAAGIQTNPYRRR
jgi:hypothetical protein